MAQRRSITASEHCRHEVSVEAGRDVPHRVYPAMDAVQAPASHPLRDRRSRDSKRHKLRRAHNSVLARGEFRHLGRSPIEFVSHV